MRKLPRNAILICLLVSATPAAFPQASARVEKVAEGQYLEWQEGHPLMDTAQTWTIWRTNDGYEVEDKLPVDKGALLMAAMGAAPGLKMSPALREELNSVSIKTGITLELTEQREIEALVLNGKKSSDPKESEMMGCHVKGNEITCKGREGAAHAKNSAGDQFLYSYPFPLLFAQIVKQSRPAPGQTIPLSLVVLDEVKNKPQLTKVSAQFRGEGPERMAVGQYTFDTEKFVLAFDAKSGARQITLWTSPQGIVFAMEDSQFASGLRVTLSKYKKYSEF